MKKILLYIVFTCLFIFCFSACNSEIDESTVETTEKTTEEIDLEEDDPGDNIIELDDNVNHGGWIINDSLSATKLDDDINEIFNGAFVDYVGANYEPVLYLGSNLTVEKTYAFLCKTTTTTYPKNVYLTLVYISCPEDASPLIKEIRTMDINDIMEMSDDDENRDEGKKETWQINDNYTKNGITNEEIELFNSVTKETAFEETDVISLLATNTLEYTGYSFLAVTNNHSNINYKIVYLISDSDEGLSITGSYTLNQELK